MTAFCFPKEEEIPEIPIETFIELSFKNIQKNRGIIS